MTSDAKDIKKAIKQVTSIANEKLGSGWSLVVTRDGGQLQVEARITGRHLPAGKKGGRDDKVIRSVVWCGGRVESRTTVA